MPLERLTGSVSARGRLLTITKGGVSGQRHIITLNKTDLQAQLDATQDGRAIGITGAGDAKIDIVGGELSMFDARFNGQVDTADVPKDAYLLMRLARQSLSVFVSSITMVKRAQ